MQFTLVACSCPPTCFTLVRPSVISGQLAAKLFGLQGLLLRSQKTVGPTLLIGIDKFRIQQGAPEILAAHIAWVKGSKRDCWTHPKIPPPPKRKDPAKDSICHECGETGHWKRNCPQYLAELLRRKRKQQNLAFWSVVVPEDDLEMDERQVISFHSLGHQPRRSIDRMYLYIDAEDMTAYYDYEIGKMDVKTAFLNGYLNEEVYMEQPKELRVSCYTDARYLTDADDLKSQTGYVFVLNGGAVDWKSAKQKHFRLLICRNLSIIVPLRLLMEAVWVRKFISGLGVVPTLKKPINMYCDNTGAIAIANEFWNH
ncbi:retrotransposon protein, putative, ty1-copia subclass [Tanacetum coccineum]